MNLFGWNSYRADWSNTLESDLAKFQGFLYEPRHGTKVAWSVFLSENYTGPHRPRYERIQSAHVNVVLLNEGGVYDPDTHFFTIKTPGTYMLRQTGGITVRQLVDPWTGVDLNINTQTLITGDILYIVDEPLYGDTYLPTGFMGILLYDI